MLRGPNRCPIVHTLTRREAARLLGVSERAVARHREALLSMGQAKQKGARILYRQDGLPAAFLACCDQARMAPDRVERLQQAITDGEAAAPEAPDHDDAQADDDGEVPKWSESRARREAALARKAELELQRMEGALVSREAVGRDWFEASRQTRDHLLRLAIILPPELKRCNGDLQAMNILLHERITDILHEMCADMKRREERTARNEMEAAQK